MNSDEIIKYLEENDLSDVEDLNYKGGLVALRFYYDFDEDEIKAAKAYANDESEDEEKGEIWKEDFFLPYLNDLAVDNVGEIMEEVMDKFTIDVQFISYDIDEENQSFCEFISIFYAKGKEIEIEDILDEINI